MTAALYPCTITHVRALPIRRTFRYRSYLWLVDLDDLPRIPPPLRPLAQFRARDHLAGAGGSIRASVSAYLARHGTDLAGGRILMLGHARVLGHVFNPLTVFWCHYADGTRAAVIAEVHNTYGGRHAYLLHPDSRGRAEADKNFYVSPFLPAAGRYRLHLPEPGSSLRLGVTLHLDGQTVLAARGAQVTALTISPTQAATARRRAAAAAVADRVDVQLRDYRQASGRYDVVVSVEMIEAVGERYWPIYFATIDRLLAPGGRAGLQAITMPHDRMLATRGGHTWIHKHIFPGGQIPSLQAITDNLQAHTTLRVTADYPMGPHYACTLAEWRSRFLDASAAVTELGFGATFQRMWNLYLAYSEAGFRAGYLDVHQLVLERGW